MNGLKVLVLHAMPLALCSVYPRLRVLLFLYSFVE